jgi:DNA repair exonuclease SbcCD nuclease subunit
MTSQKVAVLISDVHYSLKNLELSDAAMKAAIKYAASSKLPLIVAGDLHDTKALMRGEVVSRMIDTFSSIPADRCWVLSGNHDRINERAPEHSLRFLEPYCNIVSEPVYSPKLDLGLIPYQHEPTEFKEAIDVFAKDLTIIMHQGVRGADKGEYVYDKSAVDLFDLGGRRCISGHYHRHHSIGTVTYIGSPFTMSFGEANDGPKGFLVLYSDGSVEQIILPFRRHVIIEGQACEDADHGALGIATVFPREHPKKDDIVWVKLRGTASELGILTRKCVSDILGIDSFKLDKIATEVASIEQDTSHLTSDQIFDSLIDGLAEKSDKKKVLKSLWREVLNGK